MRIEPEWYSPKGLAQAGEVTLTLIYRKLAEGSLVGQKVGAGWAIDRKSGDAFLERRRCRRRGASKRAPARGGRCRG